VFDKAEHGNEILLDDIVDAVESRVAVDN
jgi:hypothetical protein